MDNIQLPCGEGCALFPVWEKCPEKNGCCDTNAGYSASDGIMGYCYQGQMYVVESLTEEKNCDDPFAGAQRNPATWKVLTMSSVIASKQDNLKGLNGMLLAGGSCVMTCTQVASAIANAVKDFLTWPQIEANVRSLFKKCGGKDIDGELVQCDQFGDLFDAEFAKEKCLTDVVDVSKACGLRSNLVAVECEGGGFTIGRIPPNANCYGVIFNVTTPEVFPASTSGTSGLLYTVNDLQADWAAGTVDQALLDASCVAEGEITVDCDGTYDFGSTNAVVNTDDYFGLGQFIITANGEILTNAAGQSVPSDVFSNQAGNYSQLTWPMYLTAGTHTIKRHYLATGDGTADVAQIFRHSGTTEVCIKEA